MGAIYLVRVVEEVGRHPLDLGRAHYVLYGVKYIDLVSLMTHEYLVRVVVEVGRHPLACKDTGLHRAQGILGQYI